MNKFEKIRELEEKRDAKVIEFNILYSKTREIHERMFNLKNEISDIDKLLFDLYDESEGNDV